MGACRSREFQPNLFSDGFHLNAQGSEIFTTRLVNQIRTSIGNVAMSDNSAATTLTSPAIQQR